MWKEKKEGKEKKKEEKGKEEKKFYVQSTDAAAVVPDRSSIILQTHQKRRARFQLTAQRFDSLTTYEGRRSCLFIPPLEEHRKQYIDISRQV